MSWQLAYYYFQLWSKQGTLLDIMCSLRQLFRKKKGRKRKGQQAPQRNKKYKTGTIGMIDSQATNNSCVARNKGFCHYKLTNGNKKHVLVNSNGLCICSICTPANIS